MILVTINRVDSMFTMVMLTKITAAIEVMAAVLMYERERERERER